MMIHGARAYANPASVCPLKAIEYVRGLNWEKAQTTSVEIPESPSLREIIQNPAVPSSM